jgi:hypothetical protein
MTFTVNGLGFAFITLASFFFAYGVLRKAQRFGRKDRFVELDGCGHPELYDEVVVPSRASLRSREKPRICAGYRPSPTGLHRYYAVGAAVAPSLSHLGDDRPRL